MMPLDSNLVGANPLVAYISFYFFFKKKTAVRVVCGVGLQWQDRYLAIVQVVARAVNYNLQ